MDEKPFFDLQIIIPAYNVEEYIEQCIDSILHQITTFKYLICIINDGST
ncbi:MAG: glycosyltransferase family 2 protein, partial [Alphaproteobacteria bacterium]|nr:glycosyltransferase family 2 protein [Alphaproteobacteria bacterium]